MTIDMTGFEGIRGWKLTLLSVTAALPLLMVVLVVARRFDPLAQGLQAQYFPNTDWTAPSSLTAVQDRPSTDNLHRAWRGIPPARFSATWAGSIVSLADGLYTFATVSDDGSRVFVDGQLTVRNEGRHAARLSSGSIYLTRGAHSLFIDYVQDGGSFQFELLWARDGSRLALVPTWVLQTRVVHSLPRVIARVGLDFGLVVTQWVWVGLLLATGVVAIWSALKRFGRILEDSCDWPRLKWILSGSIVLNATAVWWGLPGIWVPIEATPSTLMEGLSRWFSRGWFDAYPPFHFYVQTIAVSPLLLLQALGRLDISDDPWRTLVVLAFRLLSVAAGAGIVIAIGVAGTQAFGRRAGLLAAVTFAMVAPFVYYAKTGNFDVPCLFWFTLSLVFYVRLLQRARLTDYVLFAATATFAICTKDQAYGLYLFAPLLAVDQLWREHRGRSGALWRTVLDRRLVASVLVAAALFVFGHNLLFNADGFMSHVRLITGPASAAFRAFDSTLAGRIALLKLTEHLIQTSMGWPLFLFSIGGVTLAAMTSTLRKVALWLAVPIVTYYISFINVILYNYDRFVLPICAVLALFAGFALDRLLSVRSIHPAVRMASVAGVLAYSLLYAATVDVLMINDSRYVAERWMKEHVGSDQILGFTGPVEVLPTLDDFRRIDTPSIADLQRDHPAYFVQNADYANAVSPETPWGSLIRGMRQGTLGYRLVFRFRGNSPWAWLPAAHPDLIGAREDTPVFSVLRAINPTIEVYERTGPVGE